MFYLKYRPQTLGELDSQDVKKQLQSVLKAQPLPHAFLFTGPKGTGKTSTARIIAKAINCAKNVFSEKSSSYEPCNTCLNCKSITQGNSADVIEMDAASNRKIDDIRELISKLAFAPISFRYKIYIIDEVHMLTKEAFNALLKSLEEPPPSTIFILATTEADALPKTIVSRCIRIQFVSANDHDIASMIQRIEKKEKTGISDPSIQYIAQHSEGSFRDASKIFELVALSKDTSIENIKRLIGHTWEETDILDLVDKRKLKEALESIEKSAQNGVDFKTLIESLLHTLHNHLLQKNDIEVSLKSKYNLSIKETAKLIQLLQQAYNQLKYAPIESLPLEVALVEFCSQETK